MSVIGLFVIGFGVYLWGNHLTRMLPAPEPKTDGEKFGLGLMFTGVCAIITACGLVVKDWSIFQ